MTTINNLTIEQMREIVESAPDEASFYQEIDDQIIYILDGGGIHWWFNPNDNSWNKDYSDKRTMQSLNDLRTAIAEHDEFKVGDFVVLNQSHSQDRVLKIQMFHEDFIRAFVKDSIKYSFGHKINFRHATLEEIKAGHRLEAERHG